MNILSCWMVQAKGHRSNIKKENTGIRKTGRQGREGLVEYLVSGLLSFSDLDTSEYVSYERGTINGCPGCRSEDFLKEGEELVTFYRLYYNESGKNLSKVVASMENMEERIEYVTDFLWQSCGVDVTDYLKKIFTLDMLTLNEDRHLNNMAVLFRNDRFTAAPIFDNGVSLLTANQSVNWNFSMEENVRRVVARPFSGSHEQMFRHFGAGFHLDIHAASKWLEKEEVSIERDVLLNQLKRYSFLDNSSKFYN